jgi:hypothetical protein
LAILGIIILKQQTVVSYNTISLTCQGTYSQHFDLFITCEWVHKANIAFAGMVNYDRRIINYDCKKCYNSCILYNRNLQWNSTFYAFWLIIEGATEKGLQFKMQLKSIYNKTLVLIEQKFYFFNTTERFKQEKIY